MNFTWFRSPTRPILTVFFFSKPCKIGPRNTKNGKISARSNNTRDLTVTSLCLQCEQKTFSNMEERPKARRRGGRYCIAGFPNDISCKNSSYTPLVRMHPFPANPVTRKLSVEFVRKHRPDFGKVSQQTETCFLVFFPFHGDVLHKETHPNWGRN